jgi:anti-anti-sigma factor
MHVDGLHPGDGLRRPRIEVALRPVALPSYAALVGLCGEHDLATAEAIRVALAPLLGHVLVDLCDCDFIDSTVISALIVKARELGREGFRLELIVPPTNSTVRRVLEIVQIHEFVTMHESVPGTVTKGEG